MIRLMNLPIKSIIVAVSENMVIGNGAEIPWHLPEDLKLFRQKTTGHPVIMGRKTFESIGKPLPGRKNIVVSAHLEPDALCGAFVCPDLEAALAEASNEERNEIFIAGGASIYRQAVSLADRMYISRISGKYEGDAFFPEPDRALWNLSTTEDLGSFKLEIWDRKRS